MRLTLVYHRPGYSEGYLLLNALKNIIEARSGFEVELVEIKDFKAGASGDRVVLLTPLRGGHWLSIATKTSRVEYVPPEVTAGIIYRFARAVDAVGTVVLVYLTARRALEYQLADLDSIKRLLESRGLSVIGYPLEQLDGLNVVKELSGLGNCVVVSLAMSPGRLWTESLRIAHLHGCAYTPPLLVAGFDIIASWLIDLLTSKLSSSLLYYL